MSSSKTTRRRRGLTGYIGNIVDDTKDFVDDMLDRARDAEHDTRETATKLVRNEDGDEDEEDLRTLKNELDSLAEKLGELDRVQRRQQPATVSQQKKN